MHSTKTFSAITKELQKRSEIVTSVRRKMSEETPAAVEAEPPVENIPIPPSEQVLKSSDEILCELFGAFNATPPPLDDLVLQGSQSAVSDKTHKKHKKHSKKKHKKVKKKKRSSSVDSQSSKGCKKKTSKKHKKHSSKQSASDADSIGSKKKKKRKLGKFSASDSDSDEEEPVNKKPKSLSEHSSKSKTEPKLPKVKIKGEKNESKTTKANGAFSVSTFPEAIQENILKHAVSKIVDKVIRSTDLASEICKSINSVNLTLSKQDNNVSQVLSIPIKQEPKDSVPKSSSEGSSNMSHDKLENKEPEKPPVGSIEHEKLPETNNGNPEPPNSISVADVFVEDLLDCGIKKDEITSKPDKLKMVGGKIKMPNLKFSQVYEATVKQIEEEAKLKAEKYEEGEISESSEEERSPTPSDLSSSGSIEEVQVKISEVEKKKKHRHHHHRHHHRHRHHSSRRDGHRSRSHDKLRSHSHSERSHSCHHHGEQTGDKNEERDRDRRRRKSKERDRSRLRGRSKERDRKISIDRTKDRSRSRDRAKDKGRSRSKSRDRTKENIRSRSRSRDRTKDRVRSRSWDRKTKSGERSKDRRSVDRDEKRRHGHIRTHSRERDKRSPDERIDKQKLLEIARKNALNMLKNPGGSVDQTKLAITSGGKTVNELTDFCKQLSKKDADGHESISSNTSDSESESEKPFHHPFQIKDRPSSIVLNIRNSVALPVKSLQEKTAEQSRQLRLQFPVSSGQQHRKTESEWVPVSPKRTETPSTTTMQVALVKPLTKRVFKDPPPTPNMDIGSIVSQRLNAMRRLQEDPSDSDALSQMQVAQQHMQHWAESKQLPPGQFSGSTGVKVLSQAELASGYQAWARRDQLQAAAPVNSGLGMTLLQKMGWRPGEGLGKNKEGTLQPLLLEVKMDKKGLVAQEELPVRQPHQIIRGKPRSLEGKHPVSLLNEYCSRRKLGPPFFELVDEAGPDHKKNFLFKVRVNGVEYKPAVGSPKKKQARAEAAEVCLKALGILPSK